MKKEYIDGYFNNFDNELRDVEVSIISDNLINNLINKYSDVVDALTMSKVLALSLSCFIKTFGNTDEDREKFQELLFEYIKNNVMDDENEDE